MLITTAVALLLRDRRRQRHGGGKAPTSIDAPTDGLCLLAGDLSYTDNGRRLGVCARVERDAMEIRLDLADAVDSLPAHLQALARLLSQGETEASVKRLTGRSRRQVRHDVEAIRACLDGYELH